VISWQSIVALDTYLIAVIVQGLAVINNPNYIPMRWHATLLMWAFVIGMGCFNIFSASRLPVAIGVFFTIHVFAFFPIITVLLVLVPKPDASAVFLTFSDNGAGWPSIGLSTLVGQVSSLFVVLGTQIHDLPNSKHLC
jgi:choline transport protein